MKRGRTYLYILGIILVVFGTVGGAMYWRANNHQFQTQQAARRRNARAREQAFSKDEKKREESAARTAPKQIKHQSSEQTRQITSYLKKNHFVGSALIVKNNRIIYTQGFGYANYKSDTANTPSSEYQILSIQKSLTAGMIMKLVSQHKLSLNTKLSKYYPKVKNSKNITIRNMLDMYSGLTMSETGSDSLLNESNVVSFAVNHTVTRSPKYKDWYQPVNYVLLAGIISKITHKSYGKYFDKVFTKPLKLKGTGFVQHWAGRPNRTLGYHWLYPTQIKPNYTRVYHEAKASMQNELGTGQVFMSTYDLFKSEQAILKGKIVPKAYAAILHQPGGNAPYGGGVYNQSNGIRSHGIGYGYESSVFMTRNGKSGVVLLSNDYRPANQIQNFATRLFNDLTV